MTVSLEMIFQRGEYTTIPADRDKYVSGDAYKNAPLERELLPGERFILRVYENPEIKNAHKLSDADLNAQLEDIRASLSAFHPTLAWSTKDSSFVALRIEDENGVPREWGDLRTILIGMEAKIMKRLAMLGTKTYLNHLFLNVMFVDDDEYYVHRKDRVTIQVRSVRKDYINGVFPVQDHIIKKLEPNLSEVNAEEALALFREFIGVLEKFVDGSFNIRPELFNMMVEQVKERVDDDEKLAYLLKTFDETRAYNARFLTEIGGIKGDAEVSIEGLLRVDIMTYDCNLFTGMSCPANTMMIQLTPQEQNGEVRTDRQSTAHFWDLLYAVRTPVFGPSLGIAMDAMIKRVNTDLQDFRAGKPMSFVEPAAKEDDEGTIRSWQTKAMKWVNAGHSLNQAPHLLIGMAVQWRDMFLPPQGASPSQAEKKMTRLPAPYESRSSLRNETSYFLVYGEFPELPQGECFVEPKLGLIVSNHDWLPVIDSLGGADKDDHAKIAARESEVAHLFRGVEIAPRNTVLFLSRSPIGTASDGTKLASEYYVLKPTAEYRKELLRHYGKLPLINLDDRPMHVLDMVLPAGKEPTKMAIPSGASYSDEVYGKNLFMDILRGAIRSRLVYDQHSALMRKSLLLNRPFKFYAREEFFIDVCAQWRNVVDLLWIRKNNEQLKRHIPKNMPFTIMDEIAEFYDGQVKRFMREARVHITNVRTDLNVMSAGVPLQGATANNGLPILIHWMNWHRERFIEVNNSPVLTHGQFEEIGNRVAYSIDKMIADRTSKSHVDEEYIRLAIIDAQMYFYRNMQPSGNPGAPIESMVTPTEQPLMAGVMLDYLIAALA